MSSIQQRFILQRSLNPIAPRSYGLVALQKIKQGSCFKILSKSSSSTTQTNNNNDFESVTVDLGNSSSSSSSLSAFLDLSESPRTLYEYLFRRYTWNINKESAEVTEINNDNANEAITLLPPQFLFLKTESTFYALSDPKSIARQIFDARPISQQMENDEMEKQREENELFESSSVSANQGTQSSDATKSKKTSVLRNSMLLNHLLSINDSCSIPVPAADSETANLDVSFFRAFPQLLQEYELVSAQNENCRVELVTEEEYQQLFFDDANNANSDENGASQKQTNVIVGHDEHGREIRRLGGKDLTHEDRLLKKMKQEFNIGDVDVDSGEFTPLSREQHGGAGDVSYESRMKKRFDKYDEKRTGKNSAGSPFFKREARRKMLKGESTGGDNTTVQEEEEEELLLRNYGGESESNNLEQNPQTTDSEKLHLILRVTRDIPAGSEFFLCYGREYWTHFTGACVFTSSLSLPRIRWAEKYLLGADRNFRDLAAAFPDLTIGRPKPGQYYLVDRLSESPATDEAAVAEFVRRISMPAAQKESQELEGAGKTATHDLFREMLNQTAHRLLEANLKKIMSENQNENGESQIEDESQLVQKAAQAAARDGTEGLLKQELNLKRDVRMLLTKDILAGKKKKNETQEEKSEFQR